MDTLAPTRSRAATLDILRQLERKVLWLSTYMIHHANHERESTRRAQGRRPPGLVGVDGDTDDGAVFPHSAARGSRGGEAACVARVPRHPVSARQSDRSRSCTRFRGFGGAQSYPSRTKDKDDVDFSTGSVGLGVAMTGFAAIAQEYVHAKGWAQSWPKGRMISLMGDAEIDEGNIHEALLEYWKHGLRNTWWVIDYNRQSLDSVVSDQLYAKVIGAFENFGWKVITIKYGRLLERVFAMPGGTALRDWIDAVPEPDLLGAGVRGRQGLAAAAGAGSRRARRHARDPARAARCRPRRADDATSAATISRPASRPSRAAPADRPVCFIAYTIKGARPAVPGPQGQSRRPDDQGADAGVPRPQRASTRATNGSPSPGLDKPAEVEAFLRTVPFNARGKRRLTAREDRGAAARRSRRPRARRRRRPASAASSTTSPRPAARSPTASSRPRPTSPSRPTSGRG